MDRGGRDPRRVILTGDDATRAGISDHPGYTGAFTRNTAPGAIPSGSRIEKVWRDDSDLHPVGSKGTVLGSLRANERFGILYFIEWDALPKHALATHEKKVRRTVG